jgi:hypothetical protein
LFPAFAVVLPYLLNGCGLPGLFNAGLFAGLLP